MTPDWILLHLTPVSHYLFMIITFTGTWHDYYNATICTPELLYTWTPETERFLILYSWYYTLVDSRNWLIMDIGSLWTHCGHYHWTICNNWTTFTVIGETDGYWYSFHVYGPYKCITNTWVHLEVTRYFRGVYWHPYSSVLLPGVP